MTFVARVLTQLAAGAIACAAAITATSAAATSTGVPSSQAISLPATSRIVATAQSLAPTKVVIPPKVVIPTKVVVDDTNARVIVPRHPTRIVSLAPGATEMLFAAGAGRYVIATVEYSLEPPAARRVPRIGDVVAIDIERLAASHPDIAVVWPGGGNPAQIEEIARMGIPLYRQQVNTLRDIPASLRRLGVLTDTSAVADKAARELEARLAQISRTYANPNGPGVLLEVWNHPIYTIGGTELMSDVLRICGTRNVFGDLRDLGSAVDVEAVIARDPDIIVAAAPPGAAAEWLSDWKRFPSLEAVRTGRLIGFEDQRLTRLGPSVVDAAEGLCKVLAAAWQRPAGHPARH